MSMEKSCGKVVRRMCGGERMCVGLIGEFGMAPMTMTSNNTTALP